MPASMRPAVRVAAGRDIFVVSVARVKVHGEKTANAQYCARAA